MVHPNKTVQKNKQTVIEQADKKAKKIRCFKGLKEKFFLLAGFSVIVFLAHWLQHPCIYIFLTGFPCPGCGMTRACLAALRLDFKTAFSHHMMFWSIPVLLFYYFLDGRLFKQKMLNKAILIGIAAGFIINWFMALSRAVNL
ncbi:MAG: DUF2752 domain-containing protein [Clostridia bacterium]|nr:DUF2752 domain-containing protein [Clostridia bacterium]